MPTTTPMRIVVALATASLAAVALAGCNVIQQFLGGSGGDATRDDNGQVIAGNDNADVFLIKVGDCVNDADLGDVITSIPIVPCTEPHDSEVYYELALPGSDFPGDDAVLEDAQTACFDAFETFTGIAGDDSELAFYPLTPTEDSWTQSNDRLVSCLIYDPAGQTTGSLEGAAR